MSFLYPIGLLGLIGIPILIIVYILKSKYTEQTVSSTYLWRLSERFLKRKNPISRITGIISLILQILSVVCISLAIAHPVFTLHGLANEYCFILDASGSMNMEEDGKTRFDLAKGEIKDLINSSAGGSRYTLIYMGEATRVVYEKTDDKTRAITQLEALEASYAEPDQTEAIAEAQRYFTEEPSTLIYLVTDTVYEKIENVEHVKVGSVVENFALKDVTYQFSGNQMTVSGVINAYETSRSVELALYVDDLDTPVQTGTFMTESYAKTTFAFLYETTGFTVLKVEVVANDALAEDNCVILYNSSSEVSYKTMLVSDTPFFIESVIAAISNAPVDVVATADYTAASGYGLYIFDNYSPEVLPEDGAVWLVNPERNIADSGFTVQDPDSLMTELEALSRSTSSSSTVKRITNGLFGSEIYISEYVKCGLYRNFTTIYSYKGNPIVFVGGNAYGNRQVVFAFDLHDSNLPMLPDYIVLMQNLLEYSFPQVLEESLYYAGDELEVNMTANCDSVKITSPSGEVVYLDTSLTVGKHLLDEVGTYTVTVTVAGTAREFFAYVQLPTEERTPFCAAKEFCLQGEREEGGYDGVYDDLIVFVIALVVLVIADWGVYCYEKYQLR